MKQAKPAGNSRKHTAKGKHAGTAKRRPAGTRSASGGGAAPAKATRVAKAPAQPKPRALPLGQAVACCTAEALAASLRLAGWPVGDEDTLALHRLVADGPDGGALIVCALWAALDHGLAGVRPFSFAPVDLDDPGASVLGLELPDGPHAVTVDASGLWWSWGAPHDPFPGAVVEEAWAVRWP